jgi:two-component system, chemotaxis family, protein-glutamate methylesterase/glutaminase
MFLLGCPASTSSMVWRWRTSDWRAPGPPRVCSRARSIVAPLVAGMAPHAGYLVDASVLWWHMALDDHAAEPKVPACFIAIGASGGRGMEDVKALLGALPDPLAAIVLVVLHRPTDRLSHLRAILSRASPMPVVIAEEGERFQTGTCYIGEPAGHLTLIDRSLAHLIDDPGNGLRNRTIDTLFHSLAAHAGRRTIGVVLSGSLDDGSRGLAAIKAAGGITMVLTSAGRSSRGMPENAKDYDAPIDKVGTPEQIAQEIGRLVADGVSTARHEPAP